MQTKVIQKHPNYTIDSNGGIFSTRRSRYLSPWLSSSGYWNITIEGRHHRLHRLIAQAFVPNPGDFSIVDHIDCNKQNNSVSNLRWVQYDISNHNRKAFGETKHRGIWLTKAGNYAGSITRNGVRHYLGVYPSLAEILEVYKITLKKVYC